MKGKFLSTLGIIALAIGLLFIIGYNRIKSEGIVTTGGIIFSVVGLCNLLFFTKSKTQKGMVKLFAQMANIAAIVLGVCMLIFNETFQPLIYTVFGIILAIAALWQLFILLFGVRPYRLPAWTYVFPALAAIGSAIVFVKAGEDEYMMMTTGIVFVVLSIATFTESALLGIARRHTEQPSHTSGTTSVAAPARNPASDKVMRAE